MDNVVQNINITDIIPSKFQPSPEEKQKIGELAILIKQFGLLDPILVRPKDGKYEIVLGIDKYQAALLANQTSIPVIIKEVNDEVYSKYTNIDNIQDISLPNNQKEQNIDVISLDELSKIKLEYERDDVKMNNEQLNNNMTNNNFGAPSQGPTFGGRFFPSLEDEPTNMNMMSGINTPPTPPVAPSLNTNEFNTNSNLIDLTDLSLDKDLNTMTMPNLGPAPTPQQPTLPNMETSQINNFELPDFNTQPTPSMPTTDNILNIESLQNSSQVTPVTPPTNEPISSEPVSMDILNADFGPPSLPKMDNNFGYPMGPSPEFNQPMTPSFTDIPNPIQPNYGMNETTIPQPGPSMMDPQPMPNFDMNMVPPMQPNFVSMPTQAPTVETNIPTPKDITPVTTTLKNLATSLEAFGYKINITEEDLPTSAKITIEVEK